MTTVKTKNKINYTCTMGEPTKAIDWALPGIGAAANIVGGAIARGQAVRDHKRDRQEYLQDREYNTPKNQLRRVMEAGLPGAAYFTGGANSQSAPGSPTSYETDNGLGQAGEAIGKFQSTRLERIATETALQNLAILTNQRKISDADTKRQLETEYDTGVYDEDGNMVLEDSKLGELPMVGKPHFYKTKENEEKLTKLNADGKDLENKLRKIDLTNAPDKIKAEIEDIVQKTLESISRVEGEHFKLGKAKEFYGYIDSIGDQLITGKLDWSIIGKTIKALLYTFAGLSTN